MEEAEEAAIVHDSAEACEAQGAAVDAACVGNAVDIGIFECVAIGESLQGKGLQKVYRRRSRQQRVARHLHKRAALQEAGAVLRRCQHAAGAPRELVAQGVVGRFGCGQPSAP